MFVDHRGPARQPLRRRSGAARRSTRGADRRQSPRASAPERTAGDELQVADRRRRARSSRSSCTYRLGTGASASASAPSRPRSRPACAPDAATAFVHARDAVERAEARTDPPRRHGRRRAATDAEALVGCSSSCGIGAAPRDGRSTTCSPTGSRQREARGRSGSRGGGEPAREGRGSARRGGRVPALGRVLRPTPTRRLRRAPPRVGDACETDRMVIPDVLLAAILSIFLFLALVRRARPRRREPAQAERRSRCSSPAGSCVLCAARRGGLAGERAGDRRARDRAARRRARRARRRSRRPAGCSTSPPTAASPDGANGGIMLRPQPPGRAGSRRCSRARGAARRHDHRLPRATRRRRSRSSPASPRRSPWSWRSRASAGSPSSPRPKRASASSSAPSRACCGRASWADSSASRSGDRVTARVRAPPPATRATSSARCSATRTGAVPPAPSRLATEPSIVSTSRTSGRQRGETEASSASVDLVQLDAALFAQRARAAPRSRARRGTGCRA